MSASDTPVFDPEQLPLSLESRDEDVLREFYELFLVQLTELIDSFGSAAPVLQTDAVRRSAHKLKSSSFALGAVRLGEQLAVLEERCLDTSPAQIELLIVEVVNTALLTEMAVRDRLRDPGN